MDTPLDAALGGETPVEPVEVQPEPQAEAPEPTPEPEAQPEPKPEPNMVPVSVVAELRQEIRNLKAAQTPQPQTPDFLDQEGAQYLQSQMQMMQANMAAEMSEAKARMQHGDDAVNAAFQAAEAANAVHQFQGQPDAWGMLVQWHQAQKVQAEIGNDPAAYKERLEAEIRAKVEAEMVAKAAKDRAGTPAPSLAGATGSRGGPVSTWNGPTPLENVFK